jgi:3-methyladenine DNA glycosylase/8-oxoguanine DNA glycosylase
MRLGRRPRVAERFSVLARSIAHQQLAGRAAASIWDRVRALVDGELTAEAVLALDERALRGAGLSEAKTAAFRDLARLVHGGAIRLDTIGRRADETVVAELTRAKGVGPWTAHMFLLFGLHRLDVWPTADHGVRVGYARIFGLAAPPTVRELDDAGDRFRPYRSVVAWYCWRAVDTETPGAVGGGRGELDRVRTGRPSGPPDGARPRGRPAR